MRVAIVGSRSFTDKALIERAIARLAVKHLDLTIVSGGARGADSIAEQVAKDLHIHVITHLPEWDRLGKSAGFARNKTIVADADMVIAFFAPGPKSRGTLSTVVIAQEANVPVHTYHEGRWEQPTLRKDV